MPKLTSPLQVRSLRLNNRIVFPPMRSRKAALDGYVSDEIVKHYTDRAIGPGLIIVEHAYIMESGRLSPQLGISDDKFIPGLSRLVDAVHSKGTPLVLQISHAGCASSFDILGARPVAPSAVKHPRRSDAEVPRPLNVVEIEEISRAFGQAATRAQKAGFDGIEVHNAHGFLLSQFASPLMNKRDDEYGGSVENRIRLAVTSVKAIRQNVGSDYPLFCRFGAEDLLPGGLSLQDGIEMATHLVAAGIDVLDVTGGMGGAIPSDVQGQGFFIPQAEAVKRAVHVPVIGVGGIVTPDFADAVIRAERVDLVAIGRAMWNDSTWAIQALQALERQG